MNRPMNRLVMHPVNNFSSTNHFYINKFKLNKLKKFTNSKIKKLKSKNFDFRIWVGLFKEQTQYPNFLLPFIATKRSLLVFSFLLTILFRNFNIYLLYNLNAHVGNPSRIPRAFLMNKYIVAERNELAILNMQHATIDFRKAIALITKDSENRGSVVAYNPYQASYPIYNNSIVSSVQAWIPGLISNYLTVSTNLRNNNILKKKIQGASLDRTQLQAQLLSINLVREDSAALGSPLKRQLKAPSLSVSLTPNLVWLREMANAGIPSVAILNTDALYGDTISHPIIGNSKAPQFGNLVFSYIVEGNGQGIIQEAKNTRYISKTRNQKRMKKLTYKNI